MKKDRESPFAEGNVNMKHRNKRRSDIYRWRKQGRDTRILYRRRNERGRKM
jgi:hypothetical protein